jgi:hypothetical protein
MSYMLTCKGCGETALQENASDVFRGDVNMPSGFADYCRECSDLPALHSTIKQRDQLLAEQSRLIVSLRGQVENRDNVIAANRARITTLLEERPQRGPFAVLTEDEDEIMQLWTAKGLDDALRVAQEHIDEYQKVPVVVQIIPTSLTIHLDTEPN